MIRQTLLKLFGITFAFVLSIGCELAIAYQVEAAENTNAATEEAVPAEQVTLEDWSGAWNNVMLYFDHEQVQQAFTEIAEMTERTEEDVDAMFAGMFANDFASIIINDSTISFYDVALEDIETDADPITVAEYKHVGTLDNGVHLFYSADETAPYAYLGLYEKEIGEDDESMTHFHCRYGTSVEDLITEDFWYPTFVSYDTQDIAIYNGFIEFVEFMSEG